MVCSPALIKGDGHQAHWAQKTKTKFSESKTWKEKTELTSAIQSYPPYKLPSQISADPPPITPSS
jgi:hypothetical protein